MNNECEKKISGCGGFEAVHEISPGKEAPKRYDETKVEWGAPSKDKKGEAGGWRSGKKKKKSYKSDRRSKKKNESEGGLGEKGQGVKRCRKKKKKEQKSTILYALKNDGGCGSGRNRDPGFVGQTSDETSKQQRIFSSSNKWGNSDFSDGVISCEKVNQLTGRLEGAVSKMELLTKCFSDIDFLSEGENFSEPLAQEKVINSSNELAPSLISHSHSPISQLHLLE